MEHGAQKVLIRTVDTFVVVIAIAEYSNLCLIRPDVSVCIAFGMGKHFQYKSIDTICEALGPRKAKALFTIPFHHLLRYHIVLPGKRKKSARDAWNAYEEVMEAFLSVLDSKFTPSDADFAVFSVIEQFVVVLYDKNSSASKINATRRELFTKKGRPLESIPPTQPAKTSVSPRSSPLGTFREKERLRLSGRNSILMTQINVYIINPVVMGFQTQICPILRVFWSILVKCCVHLRTSSSKTQTLLLEKSIFHKY